MKVIGIDINSTEALFCLIQENNDIEYKKFSIKNDDTSGDLMKFYSDIKNLFTAFEANRIAIAKRGNKGKFAASSVSFKLESLIQIASENEVEIVSPLTVAAFVKKNPLTFIPKFNYQRKCAELAYYLLIR